MNSKKSNPMTQKDGSRIQSHADRTGTNQSWKSRAQSAGDRNASNGGYNSNGGATNNGEGSGECGCQMF